MTDSERVEAISVEKALEHTTMRAIVRDFSPDKHNMMILADEVKRLRGVLANEVKCHVEKIDRMKQAESSNASLRREIAELVEAMKMAEFLARGGDGDATRDTLNQFIAKHDKPRRSE